MAAERQLEAAALDAGVPVGIAGAGVMGAGIAQVAALAGHPVRLFDAHPGAASAAVQQVGSALNRLAQKEKIELGHARNASILLSAVDSLHSFAECGLSIEAISEDLDAKRALFREMEKHIAPHVLLATNTSSLSITAIATALQHPQRLAGMHFFNPAPLMPLVEIVCGASTLPRVVETLYATASRWGKTPVRARSSPGFIVNRVARPFYAEALRGLQEQAADCPTIDAVMRECGGFRIGPFELMDLIGNDVNYAVTRSVFEAFYGDPRFTPSHLQLELVQAGYLGRKTGRGFYTYEFGKPLGAPSTAAQRATPRNIQIYGNTPFALALTERLAASGARFVRETGQSDGRVAACDNCALFTSDGRTATVRAAATAIHNTVLIDLALDYRVSTRMAIAVADQADPFAIDAATGMLQSAGYAVSVIDDVPGMIVTRTVAMLVNEAADTVNQGVCSVADLDLAMRKGVNYPHGPLEWADASGLDNIVRVLDHLAEAYGDGRYRASPLLRRKALAHSLFTVQEETQDAAAACETIRG